MATRKDICTPRTNGEKTYWTKVGTAWFNDKGGISLEFDALPIPTLDDKGQLKVRAMLFDPKSRDGGSPAPAADRGNMMSDDDIPF